MVLPLIKSLKDILKFTEKDSELANNMRASIIDNICSRYSPEEEDFTDNVQRLLQLSSYLDPRFKNNYIRDKEVIRDLVVTECDKYCKRMYDASIDSAAASAGEGVAGAGGDDVSSSTTSKRRRLASFLPIDNEMDNSNQLSFKDKVNSDMMMYEGSVKVQRDESVLSW